MKKNFVVYCLSCAVVLASPLVSVVAGSENETPGYPKEEMVIEGKKPARFDHVKHLENGLSCGTCHHNKDHEEMAGEDIASMENTGQLQCVGCHNESFSNAKLNKAMSVFHAQCKECHKKGMDGKKGPTTCDGCHIKKAE